MRRGPAVRARRAGAARAPRSWSGSQPLVEHVAAAGMRIVNNTEFASRADVVVVAGHDDLHYRELKAPPRPCCAARS